MSTSANNNDPRFVGYYSEASSTAEAFQRAQGLKNAVLRARAAAGLPVQNLDVADIGCNAGTQSRCWLEDGHNVSGLDISDGLIALARQRNEQFGEHANFSVGSATKLPWPDQRFDIVLLPELLEHVDDWQSCINEAVRVLKPGGTIFLSTTNYLCPVQQEFDLPMYSWYPGRLKQYFVKKSLTTSRHLVNFTSFPAVHWFSPYGLKSYLGRLGVSGLDRFDLIDLANRPAYARALVWATRKVAPLRFLGHVLTPSTIVIGHKKAAH